MAHSRSAPELQLALAHPAETGQSYAAAADSSCKPAQTERQLSSKHCSTSSSEEPQHSGLERCRSKPSSVRSRAAFFEALNSPPGTKAAPAEANPFSNSSVQERLASSKSNSISALLAESTPYPTAAGQEVEMVDRDLQGNDVSAHLAKQPRLSVQFSPPNHSSAARPVGCSMSHRSVFEIQTRSPSSSSDSMSPKRHSPPKTSWQSLASPTASAMNETEDSTAVSNMDGVSIEMQEQGHAEMLEHALERLRDELAERDRQSIAAASALTCKTQECESLMRVVRELTESRSKLVCAKTNLAEKLAEMQHEYMRLMRVADLSRVVSKENVAKTAKAMQSLKKAEDESARQQHLIGYFKERNKNLKDENIELKERLCLLERLDLLSYSRDSVCMREFKLHALKETY